MPICDLVSFLLSVLCSVGSLMLGLVSAGALWSLELSVSFGLAGRRLSSVMIAG